MAATYSFDVVSQVDMQEVDNAVNQAKKEISQRYDFKNSKSEIELGKDEIKIISDDEYKLEIVVESDTIYSITLILTIKVILFLFKP